MVDGEKENDKPRPRPLLHVAHDVERLLPELEAVNVRGAAVALDAVSQEGELDVESYDMEMTSRRRRTA